MILLVVKLFIFISVAKRIEAKSSVTFFTVLRNITENTNTVLHNWIEIADNVVIFADSETPCLSIIQEFPTVKCIKHNCLHFKLQIPLVPCILRAAETVSKTSFLMFANDDIFFSPIRKTLHTLDNSISDYRKLVAVGHSSEAKATIRSQPPETIMSMVSKSNGNDVVDYFLFTKETLPVESMPPFLCGSLKWRNWVLSEIIMQNLSVVVDISQTVSAVRQFTKSHVESGLSPQLSKHNVQIWKSLHSGWKFYELGRIDYVDWRTVGNAVVSKPFNHQSQLIKSLYNTMHESGFIFVISVSHEQLPLLDNWLLWANQINLTKFLIFAMDQETQIAAKLRKLPSYRPKIIENMTRGEKYFVRNVFFQQLINVGLSFLSLGLDTIFQSNPAIDIFLGEVFGHKNRVTYSISSSFFGISSKTGMGEVFFKKVAKCWESTLGKLRKAASRNLTTDFREEIESKTNKKYQMCFDRAYFEMKKDPASAAAISMIPIQTLTDSYETFELTVPQSMGFLPSVVLVDSPGDVPRKIELLKQWHLWLATEDRDITLNPLITVAVDKSLQQVLLTIRIITMDRPESLARLLTSLQKAHYEGDTVHIEFHIDKPASSKKDTTKYEEVLKLSKEFEWPYGVKKLYPQTENAGIFKMWVKPFSDQNDGSKLSILMVLEDDMEVSPYYYHWAKRVMVNYSSDNSNLYGFTIQRQHSVLGIKKGGKYQLTYVDKQVDPSAPLYRYQLLSTWGQFFFPRHWNAFVKWALPARQLHSRGAFTPCVPYLFCNKWYLDRPQHIWSIWFNYYVYQTGLTNLYVNYHHYSALHDFGLLINYRENGLHFSSKAGPPSEFANVIMINESFALQLQPLQKYPLYNFFFHSVKNELELKNQWRFTSAFGNRSCITNLK
mmetsp:Transcript_24438/g.35065  ORF Transcript_24438/g.35065 Transcript_24438/m.35065 type:complete len:892 (+) Transcript_24438:22-2697(+)